MDHDFNKLGELINAIEFDHVFTISVNTDGVAIGDWENMYAPEIVEHSAETDVAIMGDGWEALTGFTGQYGYHGAVNHPSEFIGSAIARELVRLSGDEPQAFVVTLVTDPDGDDADGGWAILHYVGDRKPFAWRCEITLDTGEILTGWTDVFYEMQKCIFETFGANEGITEIKITPTAV